MRSYNGLVVILLRNKAPYGRHIFNQGTIKIKDGQAQIKWVSDFTVRWTKYVLKNWPDNCRGWSQRLLEIIDLNPSNILLTYNRTRRFK